MSNHNSNSGDSPFKLGGSLLRKINRAGKPYDVVLFTDELVDALVESKTTGVRPFVMRQQPKEGTATKASSILVFTEGRPMPARKELLTASGTVAAKRAAAKIASNKTSVSGVVNANQNESGEDDF